MKTLKPLIITVLFALLVNSCNNPFNIDNPAAGEIPAGKGSLTLSITGIQRTILPTEMIHNEEALFYELQLTRASEQNSLSELYTHHTLQQPIYLSPGDYYLTINVYENYDNITEKYSNLLFTGTTGNSITIESGQNTPVTINLAEKQDAGEGTFSWDLTFPDGIVSADILVKPKLPLTGTDITIPLIIAPDGGLIAQGDKSLSSGTYDVILTMKGSPDDKPEVVLTVTRKEVLHIYNGYDSNYEDNFSTVQFNSYYTVTLAESANSTNKEELYVVHGDTIHEDYFDIAELPVVIDWFAGTEPELADAYLFEGDVDALPSYTFNGWYNNGDPWDSAAPVFDNITLYPQWSNDAIVSGFENIVDYINDTTIIPGEYTLFIADDVILAKTLTINSGVTLTVTSADVLNPSTISRGFADTASNSGLFIVGETGANLTLENIIIDGKRTDYANNRNPLVYINYGTFTMNDGAVLRNNYTDSSTNGGGVSVVNNGIFTMTGGTISGNGVGESRYGGGVYVASGTFEMTGGTISGNTAAVHGAGVYVSNGTFDMSGGVISDNQAISGNGGGVYVFGYSNTDTFKMSGNAKIIDNTSGGGVYFAGTTLELGGAAVIKDNYPVNNNIYLDNNKYITLGTGDDVPATGMEIWVQTAAADGVIVQSGATSGDEQYFHADNYGFVAFAENSSNNGQLVLKSPTAGLTFGLISNGGTNNNTYWVKKPESSTLTGELVIPSHYRQTPNNDYLPVREIGEMAFSSCTGITSITIPNSVTSIGGWAFSGCTSLNNVIIPNGVTSIVRGAFSGCTSLTNITIPDSVETIAIEVFERCTSLTTITIAANNSSYFSEGGILYNKAKTQLLAYPTASGSVDILSSVTSIGQSAFTSCTSITSITIPDSVTSIGSTAFYRCTSLTTITIPNNVTSIGGLAFSDCTGLTTITIPNNVTSIGGSAFSGCTSLASITVDSANTSYVSYGGILYNAAQTAIIAVAPVGISGSVTLPSGLTTIIVSAFMGCTKLTAITIPNGVTTIGGGAFQGCTNLDGSITIPASVTSIGNNAFVDCTKLTSVICLATTPPALGANVFPSNVGAIKVPATSFTAYTAADGWDSYVGIIGPME